MGTSIRSSFPILSWLGHALVETGCSVFFIPTFQLVGRLLRAKRDYELEGELRLDRFQIAILDDIGYVLQSREEMEIIFTYLAERVRTAQRDDYFQPGPLRMGLDIQGSNDHCRGHRPSCAAQHHY